MGNNVKERIKELLKNEHCTINQLAEGDNNMLRKLYRQINGDTPLTAEVLQYIMANFSQYDLNWVINGDGSPTFDRSNAHYIGGGEPNVFDASLFCCGVPGSVSDAITMGKMSGRISIPDSPSDVFYIKTQGDSMTSGNPRESIPDGAYVAIRKVSNKFIRWGEVYAICTGDGFFIKKVMPCDDDNKIRCVSFNSEKYPPFDVPKEEVLDMALVVGVVYGFFRN